VIYERPRALEEMATNQGGKMNKNYSVEELQEIVSEAT